ncbi:unnamed protein product, partial [Rotaria magnacalcarata]
MLQEQDSTTKRYRLLPCYPTTSS